jgi:hypothetical protein
MNVPHAVGTGALLLVMAASSAEGQSADQYRGFQIGANLTSVCAFAAIAPAQARSLHSRPALLQQGGIHAMSITSLSRRSRLIGGRS